MKTLFGYLKDIIDAIAEAAFFTSVVVVAFGGLWYAGDKLYGEYKFHSYINSQDCKLVIDNGTDVIQFVPTIDQNGIGIGGNYQKGSEWYLCKNPDGTMYIVGR